MKRVCGLPTFVVLGALAFASLTACTKHYDVAASAAAVGADATIDASEQKEQGFTRMTVRVKNLAPPDRVSAGAAAFVAWHRGSGDGQWIRIAALRYDEGAREAVLAEATVPALGYELAVTAEPGPTVAAPSNIIVFSQKVGG